MMNATQLAGIVAFGSAALLCLLVRGLPWRVVGMTNAVFALECVFGLRHRLHNGAVDLMGPLYAERADLQITLIASAVAVFGILPIFILSRKQPLHFLIIALTTLATIGLFSIEVISLHAVDAFLYRRMGSLMIIGWLWLALGLVVTLGALREIARKKVRT